MQRSYTINKGNTEIRVDFGNEHDKSTYATEVVSLIGVDNSVTVLSTKYIGKTTNWDKDSINAYLLELFDIYE